jgi:hypothetical protein
MNTIAIPKTKYRHDVLKTQSVPKHSQNLTKKEDFDCGCDEVSPEYAKKLERISKEVEEGKVVKLKSMRELEEYLANL